MGVIPKKDEKTKKDENWITDHEDSTEDCPKKGTQIPQIHTDFCLRTPEIVRESLRSYFLYGFIFDRAANLINLGNL